MPVWYAPADNNSNTGTIYGDKNGPTPHTAALVNPISAPGDITGTIAGKRHYYRGTTTAVLLILYVDTCASFIPVVHVLCLPVGGRTIYNTRYIYFEVSIRSKIKFLK